MTKPLRTAAFFTFALILLVAAPGQLCFGQTQANTQTQPAPQTKPSKPAPDLNNLDFPSDTWHVAVSPYLWMAGLDADITIVGRTAQVNQSFGDIFSNLKFGIMGVTEIRRGRIGFLTDMMWIKLGDETSIPVANLNNTLDVKSSLNSFTLTPYFAYRMFGNEHGAVDALGGVRYYHAGTEIDAEVQNVGKQTVATTDNWVDVIAGGRFRVNLTPKLHAMFIGDAGGGGSLLSWQIVGGAGYKISQRWDLDLAYRRLYYNRPTSATSGLEQTQQGLVLGATFQIK